MVSLFAIKVYKISIRLGYCQVKNLVKKGKITHMFFSEGNYLLFWKIDDRLYVNTAFSIFHSYLWCLSIANKYQENRIYGFKHFNLRKTVNKLNNNANNAISYL